VLHHTVESVRYVGRRTCFFQGTYRLQNQSDFLTYSSVLIGEKGIPAFNLVALRVKIRRKISDGHAEPIFTLTI
jgi:hypothetical protein